MSQWWDLKHNVVHVNYDICESVWVLKHNVVPVKYYMCESVWYLKHNVVTLIITFVIQCDIWNI